MIDELIKMTLLSCQQSHPDYRKPQMPARITSWEPDYAQQTCGNTPKALFQLIDGGYYDFV